jgi:CheY-like chemotaxis protein
VHRVIRGSFENLLNFFLLIVYCFSMAKHILVVDDNHDIVETVKTRLEHNGYLVDGAFSGEECLRLVENKTYDLIIMDINMPGLDGIATTCRLQRGENIEKIPVIFLTAMANPDDFEGPYGNIGTHSVIPKPFDYKDLLKLVKDKIG